MNCQLGVDSRRAFLSTLAKLPLVPPAVLAARPAPAVQPGRRILMNDFAIAGYQYYDGPAALRCLTAGATLSLQAEPANPHDSFAVAIFHEAAKLGYVPRFCNRHISRLLEGLVSLAWVVERVNPAAPPWEAVFVHVCLVVV